MTTPLDELGKLSQYLRDIKEDTLVENFKTMTLRGGRKMTFAIASPSVKELTIRFTPQFTSEASSLSIADLRQRANSDISQAFKQGKAVLEVINIDDTRTAYVSKRTKEMLDNKTFVLKAKVEVLSDEHFETMLHSLIRHMDEPDAAVPQVSKEQITENIESSELSSQKQHTPPLETAKSTVKQAVKQPSPPKKKKTQAKELEEQEEKDLEQERDRLRAKHAKKQHELRVDKTIEAQEQRSQEQS